MTRVLSPENDQEMEQAKLSSGEDNLSSPFTSSPILEPEDNCVISDQMLKDLMPDLGSQRLAEYLHIPNSRMAPSLNEYNCDPFDFSSTPDHDSILMGTSRALRLASDLPVQRH